MNNQNDLEYQECNDIISGVFRALGAIKGAWAWDPMAFLLK